MARQKALLGFCDYVFIALMLLCSAGIGIYFRFAGSKRNTTDEFMLAGRNMAIFPVAFSLMATVLSAIAIIGIPADIYHFGIALILLNVSMVIGSLISAYIFLPIYFDMKVTTAYEYLEKRFGKKTRVMCSAFFVTQVVLYMAIVLYAPALALSAVTNLSTWASVISIGAVCTFYCTLGGMKAVLWTDVFQAILMYICVFTVLIKGCMDVGGVGNVFRIAKEGGRLQLPGFEMDLTARYTVWNTILYGIIIFTFILGANQLQVQRLLTVRSLKRSRIALFVSIPLTAAFQTMCCLVGVVIYANFADCDPLTSEEKPVSSTDQLVPYYVMKSLGQYPGVVGICICGVFAASLSSVSSVVNSLAFVTVEDFLKVFSTTKEQAQWKAAILLKAITMFYGLLCVALTFLVANFGTVMKAGFVVFGMFSGPVVGVFSLGMLTTRSNEKGAIVGLVTSLSLIAWMSYGASFTSVPPPKALSVSTSGCPSANLNQTYIVEVASDNITRAIYEDFTTAAYSLPAQDVKNSSKFLPYFNFSNAAKGENSYVFPLYRISHMWYATFGFLICVVVGYAVSACTDLIEGKTSTTKPEYLTPAVRWWLMRDDESRKDKTGLSKTNVVKVFSEPNQTVL